MFPRCRCKDVKKTGGVTGAYRAQYSPWSVHVWPIRGLIVRGRSLLQSRPSRTHVGPGFPPGTSWTGHDLVDFSDLIPSPLSPNYCQTCVAHSTLCLPMTQMIYSLQRGRTVEPAGGTVVLHDYPHSFWASFREAWERMLNADMQHVQQGLRSPQSYRMRTPYNGMVSAQHTTMHLWLHSLCYLWAGVTVPGDIQYD